MISFELSDEQRMLVETAGKFARERIRPAGREADETGEIPRGLLDATWQLGFVPGSIPEQYGGFGQRSALSGVLFVEELACGDLAIALAAMAPALAAFPILCAGSEEQKNDHLPRYCDDAYRPAAVALVEPVYQFDPNQLQTSAVLKGGQYVLNGRKACVPFAKEADPLLVFAQDEEKGSPQVFLVAKDTTGLTIGEREGLMGIKGLPTFEVALEGCVVAPSQRLGGAIGCEVNDLLAGSRLALAAMAVGVARGASEYARDYAKQRYQFGEPIASRQAIAFMLADMAIEIDAARLLVWEAAWRQDRGESAVRETYLAKLYADDMVLKVTDAAVQTLGGHGYIREHPVEMWLRNGRGFASFEGIATV